MEQNKQIKNLKKIETKKDKLLDLHMLKLTTLEDNALYQFYAFKPIKTKIGDTLIILGTSGKISIETLLCYNSGVHFCI